MNENDLKDKLKKQAMEKAETLRWLLRSGDMVKMSDDRWAEYVGGDRSKSGILLSDDSRHMSGRRIRVLFADNRARWVDPADIVEVKRDGHSLYTVFQSKTQKMFWG